jgi:predicted permease
MPEWLRAIGRDLAFALRQFRRAPGFAVGVVLSLGFGIGASATVYSWMQGVILRPLPEVRDPGRVVSVRPLLSNGFGISLDEYTEWRDQSRTLAGLAASSLGLFAIEPGESSTGESQPLYGVYASANYFEVLGVVLERGRGFVPSDDQPGAPPVAVLSHAAWRRYFDADPGIIGRTMRVNRQPVRIIGIAPARFGGTLSIARFDLWVPLHTRPSLIPSEAAAWRRRDYRWLDGVGRLAPGASVELAHAEFQGIAARQAERFSENQGRGARVIPLDIGTAQRLEPLIRTMIAVTLLVVLLICSNVANILLTRASARERELAVRLSLGAARRRLVVQLMTESGLLALFGGILAIGLAALGQQFLGFLIPPSSVGLGMYSQLDLRFLGFVFAVTAGSVLAFGLAPALLASRVAPAEAIKSGGGGSGRRGGRLRAVLVITQFALALAILVATALFLRRDRAVNAMDLGFRGGDQVLLVQTDMALGGYADSAQWRQSLERAAEEIATEPGVERVALASFVPLSLTGYSRTRVLVPTYQPEPGSVERVLANGVSNGYFDLMGIPILEGRAFNPGDTEAEPLVVVVNQAFAERYFAGQPVLGRTFTLGSNEVVVVGLTRNGRYDYRDIDNAAMPLVYYAWHQSPSDFVTVQVRTRRDPLSLAGRVRSIIREVDPNIVLLPPSTLKEATGVPFAISRSALEVLSVLGLAALLLASMGLFSVMSYAVSLRTREMGIRAALGASRSLIVALVLRGALRLVVAGTVAGVAAAMLMVMVLRSRVPLLPTARAVEFAVPALLLAVSAVIAGLIPAGRAARVDPARTLRTD